MYQMWMIRWSGRTHASNSMIGAPTIAVTDTWPEPKAKNPLAASSACSCSFGGKFSEIYLRGLQLESHVVNKPRHPSLKDPSPKSTHRPNTNTTLTFHTCVRVTTGRRVLSPFVPSLEQPPPTPDFHSVGYSPKLSCALRAVIHFV